MAGPWGFHAHRMINERAVNALPPEMFGFFKRNQDFLRVHAVDPDKRRYIVKDEAPRHYIDLDHVLKDDKSIEGVKSGHLYQWKSAVENYGEDSLSELGILPWHLNLMVYKLTEAFKAGDPEYILKLSADIGHYASDAHVPLHTTENYNGQLTGQKGIHALWESRIPERHSEEYLLLTDKAVYLDNPQEAIWQVVLESHGFVGHVLKSEMDLRNSLSEDKIYTAASLGRTVKKKYTASYVDLYAEENNELVEKRMNQACWFISSLWYTAWVNAGQPDLNGFEKLDDDVTDLSEPIDHDR